MISIKQRSVPARVFSMGSVSVITVDAAQDAAEVYRALSVATVRCNSIGDRQR